MAASYTRTWTAEDSEYGAGRGIIDPQSRTNRVVSPYEQMVEIYATNPAPDNLKAGGIEAGKVTVGDDNLPEKAVVDRP